MRESSKRKKNIKKITHINTNRHHHADNKFNDHIGCIYFFWLQYVSQKNRTKSEITNPHFKTILNIQYLHKLELLIAKKNSLAIINKNIVCHVYSCKNATRWNENLLTWTKICDQWNLCTQQFISDVLWGCSYLYSLLSYPHLRSKSSMNGMLIKLCGLNNEQSRIV